MSRATSMFAIALALALGCAACTTSARQNLELQDLRLVAHRGTAMDAEVDRRAARLRAIAEKEWGPDEVRTVDLLEKLAWLYAGVGRDDRALPLAEEVLAKRRRFFAEGSTLFAPTWTMFEYVHETAGRWKEAEAALDRVVALCFDIERGDLLMPGCEREHVGLVHNSYAWLGAWDKSLAWEMAGFDTVFPPDADPSVLVPPGASAADVMAELQGLAFVQAQRGAYPEAIGYLVRSLEISLPTYAHGSPGPPAPRPVTPSGDVEIVRDEGIGTFPSQAPDALLRLLDLRRRTGAFESARRLEALERELWSRGPDRSEAIRERTEFRRRVWNDPNDEAYGEGCLAWFYSHKGDHERALAHWELAFAHLDREFAMRARGPDDIRFSKRWRWHLYRAEDYAALGRHAEALPLLESAVPLADRELPPRHFGRLETLARLAEGQAILGRRDEADATWGRYLEVATRLRGDDHVDLAPAFAGRAALRRAEGREREAAALEAVAKRLWDREAVRIAALRELPLPGVLRKAREAR